MILFVGFALALLTVPLCRGDLRALARVELRGISLAIIAILIQTVIVSVLPTTLPGSVAAFLHVGSFALALTFLYVNRDIPAIGVMALGGFCNMLVITINHGVMPASPAALRAAGKAARLHGEFRNSTTVNGAHLRWLGDVFAIPSSWPLANVFSIGDVLLVLGATMFLHLVCGSRLTRAGRAAAPAPGAAPTPATDTAIAR